MNLLCWSSLRLGGRTTLSAATPQPALLTNERAETLPCGVAEAEGYECENQKMLEPEGHVN